MLFRAASWMFVYTCVATVFALAIGAGYLWSTGLVNPDKTFKILAIVHDVSLEPKNESHPQDSRSQGPQPSYEQIATAKQIASRQLELKTMALEKRVDDLRFRQAQLEKDRVREQTLAKEFGDQLERLLDEAKTEGYATVRSTLEKLKPDDAKEYIMTMYRNGEIDDIVAILSDMSVDLRAKIIGKFQTADERKVIDEALRMIRQGLPRSELIENTRNVLQTSQGASAQ